MTVAISTGGGRDRGRRPPRRPRQTAGVTGRRRPGLSFFVASLLVALLVLPPLVSLVLGAFRTAPLGQEGSFTLSGIAQVFAGGEILILLLHSLELGVLSSIGAVLLGSTLAWAVAQTNIPGGRVWEALLPTPFYMHALFYTFALIALAGGPGYLSPILDELGLGAPNIYSLWGSAFVLIITFGSYSFLYLIGPMKALNSELLEASLVLGASRLRSSLAIGYRMVAPVLVINFVIVLSISMEIFSVPQLLWGAKNATLAGAIYNDVSYAPANLNLAAVHALVLLLVSGIGVYVYTRMSRNVERYTSITGKSRSRPVLSLGNMKWLAVGLLTLYFFLTSIVPFAALVMMSFQPFFNPAIDTSVLTLSNYREVFSPSGSGPLINTCELVIMTAIVTVSLAYFVTQVVHFGRTRGAGILQFATTASVAIPGLALGVGMLWAYVHVPWGLWGSIWVLLLGYVARWLAQGTALIRSATASISLEQDEAARVLGAGMLRRLWDITLPLTKRSALSALLIIAVVTVNEVPVSILLYSPRSEPLSVAVWNSLTGGSLTVGAAYAVPMACVSVLLSVMGLVVIGRERRTEAPARTDLIP